MMRSRCSRWISGIGAVVLTGGALMASAGLGVTVATLLWFVDPAGAIPLESWDNKIPNATLRFKVLPDFNNEAVLDRETQLVWERSPDTTPFIWGEARFHCSDEVTTGNRKGWRLPAVHELASLVHPAQFPSLPPGHPFLTVQTDVGYWTATRSATNLAFAWYVTFGGGAVGVSDPIAAVPAWCVRGGMNADVY